MPKQLIVNTAVQAAIMNNVLIKEMSDGFWKDSRPKGANKAWVDVVAVAGPKFGPQGFTVPRNYNFLNPEFIKARGADLLAAAQAVDPNITMRQLNRELTELSRIVGGRFLEPNGPIVKLNRGQRSAAAKKVGNGNVSTRKVPATIVEPEEEALAVA